jgi:hypothetical protein
VTKSLQKVDKNFRKFYKNSRINRESKSIKITEQNCTATSRIMSSSLLLFFSASLLQLPIALRDQTFARPNGHGFWDHLCMFACVRRQSVRRVLPSLSIEFETSLHFKVVKLALWHEC